MGLTIPSENQAKKEPTKIITKFIRAREVAVEAGKRVWNGDPRQALTLALVYLLLPMSFVLQLFGKAGIGWYLLCSVVCVSYFMEFWLTPKKKRKKSYGPDANNKDRH